jgi:phytol kinase
MTIASTAPTVLGELLASLWIAVPVLLLFAIAEVLHQSWHLETELTRKLSHLGSGLVVSCLPWVVASSWTVLVLAGGFVIILAGSRAVGLLSSVHAVERRTSGAIYYPIAVYLIYVLADGNVFLFQIPILIMALSDTGAAVVGKRYGIIRYRVVEDYRSLGGSTTFFGLTFALVLIGHGIAGFTDLPSVLIATLLVALITTAIEAISIRGADNVLVPYVAFLVLENTRHLTPTELGVWALSTAVVLGVLLFTHRTIRFNATGFLAAFVVGTLTASLAGPIWLVTLAVPYMGLFFAGKLRKPLAEAGLELMVPSLSIPVFLLLLYAHTAEHRMFVPFLGAVTALSSIAAVRFARGRFQSPTLQCSAGILATSVVVLPALFREEWPSWSAPALAYILIGAVLGSVTFLVVEARKRPAVVAQFYGVACGTSSTLIWLMLEVFP